MNYFTEILKHLDFYLKYSYNDRDVSGYSILRHLISIMGEKHFNLMFERTFLNGNEFSNNFHDFHKSMRQTDFFEMGEGHLDMIFWNFIHMSNATETIFKTFIEELNENKSNSSM